MVAFGKLKWLFVEKLCQDRDQIRSSQVLLDLSENGAGELESLNSP